MINTIRFGSVVLSAEPLPNSSKKRGAFYIEVNSRPQSLVKIAVPGKGELPLGMSPTAKAFHRQVDQLIQRRFSYIPEKQEAFKEKLQSLLKDIDTSTGNPQAVAYFQTVKNQLLRALTKPSLYMDWHGDSYERVQLFHAEGEIPPRTKRSRKG